VYGEYTSDDFDKVRVEVVFKNAPCDNFTIIGRFYNNNTVLEGKCYGAIE